MLLSPIKLFMPGAGPIPSDPGVWLVGGCVRDALTGAVPVDYDLVADDPAAVARRIGRRLGVRVVRLGRGPDRSPEVIHRVPGHWLYDVRALAGPDIRADLMARDFTINAMGWERATGRLADPSGGRADLGRRVRMVSPGVFAADPLRMIRAFRLAAAMELDICPDTLAAVAAHAPGIEGVAGERVREELLKLMAARRARPHIEGMMALGLLPRLIPELAALADTPANRHHAHDPLTHTMETLGHLETLLARHAAGGANQRGAGQNGSKGNGVCQNGSKDNGVCQNGSKDNGAGRDLWSEPLVTDPREAALLKWAALLHDIGKAPTLSRDADGGVHYYGHEKIGAEMAGEVCRRLRFSGRDGEYVAFIIRHHLRPLHLFTAHERGRLSGRAAARFFGACGDRTPHVLLHAAADFLGKGGPGDAWPARFIAFSRGLLARFFGEHRPRRADPPLLTGRDLIAEFGLRPSPEFKKLLADLRLEQDMGRLADRSAALAWMARRVAKQYPDKAGSPILVVAAMEKGKT